jgi:hypothetical protein
LSQYPLRDCSASKTIVPGISLNSLSSAMVQPLFSSGQ